MSTVSRRKYIAGAAVVGAAVVAGGAYWTLTRKAPTPTIMPTATPTKTTVPTTPKPTPTPTPTKPNSVTIAWIQELLPLDPSMAGGAHVTGAGASIYDTLYDHPLILDRDGLVKPRMAERFELSSDYSKLTLYLRKNLKFHNGDQLTADDFVFTLGRFKREEYYGTARINKAYGEAYIDNDYQITIEVPNFNPSTLSILGMGGFCIFPEEYYTNVGEEGFGKNPVGAGPYKFKKLVSGMLELEAFEDYWDGPPPIEKAIFKQVIDPTARASEIQAGTSDFTLETTPTDYNRLAEASGLKGIRNPILEIVYFLVNPYFEPFGDKEVRLAAHLALDKETLVDKVLMGFGKPAHMMSGKGYKGFDPNYDFPYDLEKAKEYMSNAGYSESKPLKMVVMTTKGKFIDDYRLCEACVGMWNKAYFDPELQVVTPAQFGDLRKAGELGALSLNNWSGYDGDPMNSTYWQFSPDSIYGGWANLWDKEEYTGIREAARDKTDPIKSTMDDAKRVELARVADIWAMDNGLDIPIFQKIQPLIMKENLHYDPFPIGIVDPHFMHYE